MQVHQARGGEFGLPAWEDRVEGALVVVVAVCRGVVFASDVDDRVACCELRRVAGAEERAGRVEREETEEVDG